MGSVGPGGWEPLNIRPELYYSLHFQLKHKIVINRLTLLNGWTNRQWMDGWIRTTFSCTIPCQFIYSNLHATAWWLLDGPFVYPAWSTGRLDLNWVASRWGNTGSLACPFILGMWRLGSDILGMEVRIRQGLCPWGGGVETKQWTSNEDKCQTPGLSWKVFFFLI